MTIGERALLLRSKNAGIGLITIDIVCADEAGYDEVERSLTRAAVAAAYGIDIREVLDLVRFPAGLAFKVTLQRSQIAGGQGLGETDLYGSAQYAPIAELALDGA
jgi:Domain of unknown function (DUF4387)